MSAEVRDGGTPPHGGFPLTSLAAAGTEIRSHPIVIGIGAAVVACAALATAAIQRGQLRTEGPALAAFTIVAGISFVSAGPVASARRPRRRTGALMIRARLARFAWAPLPANPSPPFSVGLVALWTPAAAL